MFQSVFDSPAFDLAVRTFAPVTRAAELSARAFEKLARFQVESAIDLVNHATARIQVTAEARSPQELAAGHIDLTRKFVEARTSQFQEFLKFTTDLQGDVTKWAEDAKPHAMAAKRQAA